MTDQEKQSQGSDDRSRFGTWMAVATTVVVLDQISKLAVARWIELYQAIPITSFLNLTHHQNKGAAFSFLAGAGGWQRWFFAVLAFAVSAYLVRWLWTIRSSGQLVLAGGLALVLGGAVGNLIDRLYLGHVTDFIQVWFGTWAFPTFNVADAAISVGAALLIIDALFLQQSEQSGK